jgi:hypothetical protein
VLAAFRRFDALYRQLGSEVSVLAEVVERLIEAHPRDRGEVELRSYKGLVAPWNDWGYVIDRGRQWATVLAPIALEG